MKITLVRHTSVALSKGICYGQSDVELSDSFEEEAANVANNLSSCAFDAVFTSPLSRCLKLAHSCGYTEAIADQRLMEMDFGDWEMKPWNAIHDEQLARWFDNWVEECATNGESFRQLINRVESFLEELQQHSYQHVCIFTHAGVIRAFGILLDQFPAEKAFEFEVNYGDVVTLENDSAKTS